MRNEFISVIVVQIVIYLFLNLYIFDEFGVQYSNDTKISEKEKALTLQRLEKMITETLKILIRNTKTPF